MFLTNRVLTTFVAALTGHVALTELIQRRKLLLDFILLDLALFVNLVGLDFEKLLDLGLETAHVIAVVLSDDLLKLGLLSLDLGVADMVITHCLLNARKV